MTEPVEFPADFWWGAATAAYQIEGATAEDGRGPSIWDTFSRLPGKVHGGDTGDLACDSYQRWAEDLDLVAALGLNAYRFSVSWPRIQPEGRGPANRKGLDHYRRIVDGLQSRGVQPAVTLYHWDLPQALQDRGGWAARDIAGRFQDYTELVAGALGDGVALWITLNEPAVVAYLGHSSGGHAPGIRDEALAYRVVHHQLLAHARAVEVLRDTPAPVSITLNLAPAEPADPGAEADVAAARLFDGLHNRAFLDPLFRGAYPADVLEHIEGVTGGIDFVADGDLAAINAPIDALGVNYYFPHILSADLAHPDLAPALSPLPLPSIKAVALAPPGTPTTGMGWPIRADGLERLLLGLRDYEVPLYVTENGAAYDDRPGDDGRVVDDDRIAFLDAHLRAAGRALAAGVDLRGYFAWSLLDNFEWSHGYSQRFGLHRVDYATMARIPKASADWYRATIAGGGPGQPGREALRDYPRN